MEWVISGIIGLAVLAFVYVLDGVINGPRRRAERGMKAADEYIKKANEARNSVNDPDELKRMRDRYND